MNSALTPCVPRAEANEFHLAASVSQRLCRSSLLPMIARFAHDLCQRPDASHASKVVSGFTGGYWCEDMLRVEAPWANGGDDAVVRCLAAKSSYAIILRDKCVDTPTL